MNDTTPSYQADNMTGIFETPTWERLADSSVMADSTSQIQDSITMVTKAVSASDIFSQTSSLNPDVTYTGIDLATQIAHPSLSWITIILLSLTLCYYIYVLYRYWHYFPTMFRVSMSINKTLMAYESQNNEQSRFGIHSIALLIMGVTALGAEYTQDQIVDNPLTLLMLTGSIVAIIIYRQFSLKICEIFNEKREEMRNIRIINIHTASLIAIIFTPIAVASASNHSQTILLAYLLGLFGIFYTARLFNIFHKNGFGSLQWFLYLCAVEILPVSFIIALAVKY